MKSSVSDVVIIGAGAVGCAIAYTLAKTGKYRIIVLEKNDTVPGRNQSARNAGVIHGGIYYPKDREPLKAQLCVRGNALLYEFCDRYHVPHKNVGKLVIATNPQQEEYLEYILNIAKENGVPGIKMITGEEVRRLEPNVRASCALHVPSSGLLEPDALVSAYASLAKLHGAVFVTGTEVTNVRANKQGLTVEATRTPSRKDSPFMKGLSFSADVLINAAGLWSDDIARMTDPTLPYTIDPVRGELAMYTSEVDTAVGMNIYQAPYGYWNDTGEKADVPVAEFERLMKEGKITRTVGVHLTPTFEKVRTGGWKVSKAVAVGPLKTVGKGKDNYEGDRRKSEDYIQKVSHFFPTLQADALSGRYTGIMAVLPDHYDFVIQRDKIHANVIHLIGIDSPGLTSSLAIGEYVALQLCQ